jgi:ElaB/YqjD/DUF883 family membrane-anchored ribosome-binding protein
MKKEDLKHEVAVDVMEALKGRMGELSNDAQEYAHKVCDKTGKNIKEHPWKAVAIAAALGFGLAAFLMRK